MSQSESNFISALQRGSEEAFRSLVETFKGRVFNTCLSFLKDHDQADDISQEVFIEVFEKVRSFRGDAALSTWIYRITVNKCLEHIRSQKRKKRWATLTSFGMNSEKDNEPVDFHHPGVALENKERAAILMREIAKLPENQRVAFTLHKLEGLSYDEISTVMQVSLSSVESLLFRAKSNLKKVLKGYYEQ